MTDDTFVEAAESGDMFADGSGADDFALPTDDRHVAIKEAKATGEPLPPTAPAEPEPEPAGDYGAADPSDGLDLSSVYAKFGIDPETATEKELTLARAFRENEILQARQATELGEWRQTFAAENVDGDEEGLEPAADDPAAAMAAALEYGGIEGLQDAYAIWESNDPVAAANWLASERVAATEQHYAAKFAEQEQRLQQHAQVENAFVEVGRTTALEAQRAREEAFVASATTATSGYKPSKADQYAAEWDEIDRPWVEGWQV
jgi:hypothetical protein